jgi:hypothetical protein
MQAAKDLNDEPLLAKIQNIDFIAKEVKYHHSCRKGYLAIAKRACEKKISTLSVAHDKAFSCIKDSVNKVIKENSGVMLTTLHNDYINILAKNGVVGPTYSAQSLEQKICNTYKDKVQVDKITNKLGKIVFSKSINIHEAYACAQEKTKVQFLVEEAACILRSEVLNLKSSCESLPYPLYAHDIFRGEVCAPESLVRFFTVLYAGSSPNLELNDKTRRLIDSVSDDVIYAVTRGHIKPSKHCLLGMGMKSMTGSKKVINILNHFGHAIGYHKAEELETDLAMTVSDRKQTTPDGIKLQEGLATGVAFDNYDENTETLSGSGTLHDTVGITYQNVQDVTAVNKPTEDHPQATRTTSSRKRSFDAPQYDLQPYRKKPKVSTFQYTIKLPTKPSNLTQVQNRDTAWMILSTLPKPVPMWAPWNSLITADKLPQQNVCYLQNISLPPTRLDVVAETLRIAQKVASECKEKYAVVTYDLGIAKPASQIQAAESPQFDNVFIMFGAFHIMMAYFSSIGFFIDGSGGDTIMLDSEVLASGSLNGFLSGKHFNRCKRLHPMLATSFRTLHFKHFLEVSGPLPESVLKKLDDVAANPSPKKMEDIESSEEVIQFMEKYEEYTQETRDMKHGATAAYWMTYIDLVGVYMLFSRACRTNDIDLFIYALHLICPIFFAVNKPNYARWTVRFLLNLLNMDETHPGIRQMLDKGALSVRRTNNPFARNPVDMTLEQTINADAASRLTGISAFQQSIAAKNKWTITRSARSAVVGELLAKAGIQHTEDLHKELKKSRIERDNADLNKLVDGIGASRDPFSADSSTNLYNIGTGKAASEYVKHDLLNFRQSGVALCDEFRNGCFQSSARFEKSISRRKVKHFASEAVKVKVKTQDLKVLELKGTRDLFGRLVYLATDMKLDLPRVFTYPLTPVPLCLAHVDGTKHSSQKSKLAKHLTTKIISEPPVAFDTYIVDAMYMIRAMYPKDLPATYGGVAKHILMKICQAPRVDFVCDTYRTPSIKDEEQNQRGISEVEIAITGPNQRRPKDFKAALKSRKFKSALLSFLTVEWSQDKYSEILEGHTLYVSCGKECFVYTTNDGVVSRDIVVSMRNEHEEADTRIVLHLKHANDLNPAATAVIRCNDTDVLCILCHHTKRFSAKVYMDTGLDSDNTRKYIDVTKLSLKIGSMCEMLPAVHAFSGCDYTSAFMRKTKVKIYDKVESSKDYQSVFAEFGEHSEVTNELMDGTELFVCDMYGKPKLSTLGAARYALFRQKYAPTKQSDPLSKLKGAESSTLPPSQSVLLQKVKRTNYVSMIWKNAHLQDPLSESTADPAKCVGD